LYKQLGCAIDAQLFLTDEGWPDECGGYTCYIASGSAAAEDGQNHAAGASSNADMDENDDELLTVTPSRNCLALVYRDTDTLRFVKYVNSTVRSLDCPMFCDVSASYYLRDQITDDDEAK